MENLIFGKLTPWWGLSKSKNKFTGLGWSGPYQRVNNHRLQRGFAKAEVRVPQLTSHSSHSLVERSLGDCGQVKRTVEGGHVTLDVTSTMHHATQQCTYRTTRFVGITGWPLTVPVLVSELHYEKWGITIQAKSGTAIFPLILTPDIPEHDSGDFSKLIC